MILAFLKIFGNLALNGIFKLFGANRDEAIGALKVINKDQAETIDDIKKVNNARDAVRSGRAPSVSDDPANRDNR